MFPTQRAIDIAMRWCIWIASAPAFHNALDSLDMRDAQPDRRTSRGNGRWRHALRVLQGNHRPARMDRIHSRHRPTADRRCMARQRGIDRSAVHRVDSGGRAAFGGSGSPMPAPDS